MQRSMQMGSRYELQLVEVETQLNVVNSLEEYINDPLNENRTIPANVGLEDPTLAATANSAKVLDEAILDKKVVSPATSRATRRI